MTVASLKSERWLDEVVLEGTTSNIDGQIADTLELPPGIGDVAIMEVDVVAQNIATVMTTPEIRAAKLIVATATSTLVDIIGINRWTLIRSDELGVYYSPDPLVLWRQNERLLFLSGEVDTNAVPTVDVTYTVKCVRVRPVELREQPAPIRLVR